MTTKTFPKYWAVGIKKNPDHKLLPKFREWFNEAAERDSHTGFAFTYYGFTDCIVCNGYDMVDNMERFKNNPTLVTLEEWHTHFFPNEKVTKPKATYTQYFKRSDWVVFTKDSINDESIESIKESRKADLASANRKQLLLNEHKKLFNK